MTAWPEQRRGSGLVAAVAARAEAWLLEPAAPRAEPVEPAAPPRPIVAVVGLGRRCGATTIARALGAVLASRDPGGAAVVSGAAAGGTAALATAPARRLARGLVAAGCEQVRSAGRLALVDAGDPGLREASVRRPAPVVLDVAHGMPPEPALALADRAVLVACPQVEPALAEVAAAALARGGLPPVVVLNRAVEPGAWSEPDAVQVGECRLGARLALAGRDPVGSLAAAASALADACGEAVSHA